MRVMNRVKGIESLVVQANENTFYHLEVHLTPAQSDSGLPKQSLQVFLKLS
jgi:hypothetical protein